MNAVAGNTITFLLTSDGERVSLRALIVLLEHVLGILREIDGEMSQAGRSTIRWVVDDVHYNSPLAMTLVGEPAGRAEYNHRVAWECLDGLERLERGEEPSPRFTEAALERAKKIAALRSDGVSSVRFFSPGHEPVEPTLHLAANVESILNRRYRFETTTLTGTLEAIDTHGRFAFKIYDDVTGQGITCAFEEGLLDAALRAIRRRVSVTGLARYTRAGRPVSVKVASLKTMPSRGELPKFGPGEGVALTGEVPSEDFVRGLRDAE